VGKNEMISALSSASNTSFGAAQVTRLGAQRVRMIVSEPSLAWRDGVIARLEKLIQLPKGWDGYAAEPVALATAIFALQMLETLCPSDAEPPQVVPGVNGDLQVEWHTVRGDIELHVKKPNEVDAWRRNANTGDDGEELSLTNDFIAVGNWLEDLERDVAAAAAA
jgi:hypothetical protein